MFCNTCGNQIPDGASFCVQCGTPVNSNPTPVVPITYGNQAVQPHPQNQQWPNQGMPMNQGWPMNQGMPMNQGTPMGYGMPMNQGTPMGQWNQPTYVGPIYASPPKNRVIYIILGLFLGGMGVHNFYAGYNSKGITQLLVWLLGFATFGLTWIFLFIWILVELCTVTSDAHGVPFS